MKNVDVQIHTRKYTHNITKAYIEISEDMETLIGLDLKFFDCKIEATLILDLDDGNTLLIPAYVNESCELVGILGDYHHVQEIYGNVLIDSALCAIQTQIKLYK